jgi:diguanylate cyclase (GGDEF)-like protein
MGTGQALTRGLPGPMVSRRDRHLGDVVHKLVRNTFALGRANGWYCVGLALMAVVVNALVDLYQSEGHFTTLSGAEIAAFNLCAVVGLVASVRAARHRGLDRRTRLAWWFVAGATVLLAASSALRPLYPDASGFPSPADLLRLAFVPVLLIGVLALPTAARGPREQHKLWLDTGTIVIGSAMLLWYLQIGPSVAAAGHIPNSVLAASIAYPGLDLVLIFGVCLVLFRGVCGSTRVPAMLLGVAMATIVIGDTTLAYRLSRGILDIDRWQLACFLIGHFLLALAAISQCHRVGRRQPPPSRSAAVPATAGPYFAIAAGYLLLVLSVRGQHIRVLGLVVGAVAMTAVVVARQIVALRQNHQLATTDTLTGLTNRRHLHDRLRLALVRGARSNQSVAALVVDLNDFKQVNDTMGHEAGDQLLVAVSGILTRSVLGFDVVARLGGDEFAVVLHNIDSADNATAVADRIIAELAHPVLIGDTPVQPSASIGIAVCGPGQLTADELLHRADVAMYAAKRHRRTGFEVYHNGSSNPVPSLPGPRLTPEW